jgi:DNA replication protein DnaC
MMQTTEPTAIADVLGEVCSFEQAEHDCPPAPPIDRAKQITESDQSRRERLEERIKRAWQSLPRSFRWARFSNPKLLEERVVPPELVAKAAVSRGSVLLIGKSGAGKTSLAAALYRRAIDEATDAVKRSITSRNSAASRNADAYKFGVGAKFLTAYELAKAGVYSPLGRRPELVDQALDATLLVIDDLGMDVEVFKQSATSVAEVIHERHGAQKVTIVTTYLKREHMVEHYGEGITRRLMEATTFVLGGKKR